MRDRETPYIHKEKSWAGRIAAIGLAVVLAKGLQSPQPQATNAPKSNANAPAATLADKDEILCQKETLEAQNWLRHICERVGAFGMNGLDSEQLKFLRSDEAFCKANFPHMPRIAPRFRIFGNTEKTVLIARADDVMVAWSKDRHGVWAPAGFSAKDTMNEQQAFDYVAQHLPKTHAAPIRRLQGRESGGLSRS